jgi:NADPH-dependent ferric siderophore reductase
MKQFAAYASIELAQPDLVVGKLCDHMLEHDAEVEREVTATLLRLRGASARFVSRGDEVRIDLSAQSLEALYFIRMAVASHIVEFAGDSAPTVVWHGDGTDMEYPPNFRKFEVRAIRNITPHMRRITFHCEDAARYVSMDALHVNLMIQRPGVVEPQWPRIGSNGLICWEYPVLRPDMRKYTLRTVDTDTGLIDIDFVLHNDAGPGSTYAARARVGDTVGLIGPGGGGLIEADWYLFAGDETALPAIARMLETLPTSARGHAFIEVADESEIQPLNFKASIELHWLFRGVASAGTTTLLPDAVRSVSFPGSGTHVYVWAGCEFDAFRSIRAYLRGEQKLGKSEHLVVSYWRKGVDEH